MKTWNLANAKERASEAPYTFYTPKKSTIDKLEEGNFVKLIFDCDVENDKGWSAERMWVLITDVNNGSFKGTLDNDPYYIPDIKCGDEVKLEFFNIIQTDIEDGEPNIIDKYSARCYVSSSVLYEGNQVGTLYREQPDEDEKDYSGWTLIGGHESDEYLDNSENWHYVSLGAVLNVSDRFKHLLDSKFDTQFNWDYEQNRFVET